MDYTDEIGSTGYVDERERERDEQGWNTDVEAYSFLLFA
jgi:hypothetical protein